MSKHFTKQFVHLRRLALATESFTEASFDHAEGRLTVRPLVIMPHVLFTVQAVVMENFVPSRALRVSASVGTKGNVRLCVEALDESEIRPRRVCLIRRDFAQCEVARCVRDERLKEMPVVRV